jgi:hypothetical protein
MNLKNQETLHLFGCNLELFYEARIYEYQIRGSLSLYMGTCKIIGLYITANSKNLPGAIEMRSLTRNSNCGCFPSFQMENREGENSSLRRWVVSKT